MALQKFLRLLNTCSKTALPQEVFCFNHAITDIVKEKILGSMFIYPEFISEEEESSIMKEIGPYLDRLRYEKDHWDDAIHGYRETERLNWSKKNSVILDRVKACAIPEGTTPVKYIHVLDLAEDGVIKPHVDSVRFCGTTIAGISLLSDSVMRLTSEQDKSQIVDVLLRRRSLYVMRDFTRYEFAHGILGKEDSYFGEIPVPRGRRISVICRNEP